MRAEQHNLVCMPIGGSQFRRGTVVATHNTITDLTPKVKFQVQRLGRKNKHYAKEE